MRLRQLITVVIFAFFIEPCISSGVELSITCPKTDLLVYEPVFIRLKGSMKSQSRYRFEIIINDKNVVGKEGGTVGLYTARIVQADTKKDEARLSADWMLLYNIDRREYFFATEGKYKFRIKEKASGVTSNELILSVKQPQESELKALKLFNGPPQVRAIYLDEPETKSEPLFRQLIKDHPNSVYAPYAHYMLLKKSYAEMIKRNSRNQDDHSRRMNAFGKLAKDYKMALDVPAPSNWHAESLYYLLHAEGLFGYHQVQQKKGYKIVTAARKKALLFQKDYPDHPFASDVKQVMKEIDQILSEDKKSP